LNSLFVIGITEFHPIFTKPDILIVKVDFDVAERSRLNNQVRGKSKNTKDLLMLGVS
jgi:hypothetical protein